jgi:hypothetical protein
MNKRSVILKTLLFLLLMIGAVILYFGLIWERDYEHYNRKMKGKVSVELIKEKDGYKLYRNGKPYYIQGAGGDEFLDVLKNCGGNSLRTWSSANAKELLDSADALGLTVTLGLDIGRPRLGFDYGDDQVRQDQLEWVKKEVLKYKDHPALLMWAVGNEVSEHWNEFDLKLWRGLNEVAALVHEIDPNHPVTTMLPPKSVSIFCVNYFCPEVNILSINTFGALPQLKSKLERPLAGWNGAYIVSEWGPKGYWEADSTSWLAPIEQTSTQKADFLKRYYSHIENEREKCIGSYTFYWGNKHEKTATWFSLFSKKGEKTERVDLLHFLWKGSWPTNRVPAIFPIKIDGKSALENIVLKADSLIHKASVEVSDPENDSLSYSWHILKESVEARIGGDAEVSPDEIKNINDLNKEQLFYFTAPKEEGAYRLYVYVRDGNKNLSTANVPFYVVYP